jgi:hypothetical protein
MEGVEVADPEARRILSRRLSGFTCGRRQTPGQILRLRKGGDKKVVENLGTRLHPLDQNAQSLTGGFEDLKSDGREGVFTVGCGLGDSGSKGPS